MNFHNYIAFIVLFLLCKQSFAESEVAIQATSEIPAEERLDVGIEVFDSGISKGYTKNEREAMGLFRDLRDSEARFIPYHLKTTLESTGQWGAVRVLPRDTGFPDVRIRGRIVKSSGLELRLVVRIEDATGDVWLEKEFDTDADPKTLDEGAVGFEEPFQRLYNEIANALLKSRRKRSTNNIYRIREVSHLRFAGALVPQIYGDYLSTKDNGKVKIKKMPAADDPMMARIDRIRARDNMFVDTVNEHYARFYVRMERPYDEFRKFSYEEEKILRREKQKANKNKLVGGLLILGGLLAETDSYAGQTAKEVAILGGFMTLRKGFQMSQEAEIHVAALQELAASVDAEVTPMLVDVEGETLRLQGSAESQYQEWNQLLTQIFTAETGIPTDTDPAPDPSPEVGDLN